MDIKRNALLVALAVVSYLMLLAWNEDYPVESAMDDATVTDLASGAAADRIPSVPESGAQTTSSTDDLPQVPVATAQPSDTPDTTAQPALPENRLITINTPKQHVTIDLLGGDIVEVSLPDFPVSLEAQDQPFRLLRQDANMVYIAQSGLIGRNGPDGSADGRPLYSASDSSYEITSGEATVDLSYTAANGVEITKRFTFDADDYLIGVQYLVDNHSGQPWQANMYGQIKRNGAPDPSDNGNFSLRTFLGAAITTDDDPYVKYELEDIDDGVTPIEKTGGWITFSQHYFLGGWIPDGDSVNTFTLRRNSAGEYLLTFVNSPVVVAPGQTGSIEADFWAGPKDQYRLEEVSPNLELTIDYGMFTFIASPIFWLLTQINDAIGNYGVSILLMTLIIKIILYPLSAKSLKSMAKMRKLAPKINAIKEKCGDDKQKFMQEQMALWKKEQVNPFGGCLPMLLQMPVFLGIYWVLNESVELRQASFILWYDDLSKMDPYFILPLLMGAAMFLQQSITPMQTADPAQAKMMKFMPVIFTVFFLWFPAGLVLYYTANSVLSILQQWIVTKQVEKTYKPKGT